MNLTEKDFETLIVDYLRDVNGLEEGSNFDYDRKYAFDTTRLFQFLN